MLLQKSVEYDFVSLKLKAPFISLLSPVGHTTLGIWLFFLPFTLSKVWG